MAQLKLRIGILDSAFIPAPPPPAQIWVALDLALSLSKTFVRHGHEVIFYAPEGSRVPPDVQLVTENMPPLIEAWPTLFPTSPPAGENDGRTKMLWDQMLMGRALADAQAGQLDIIHTHNPIAMLSFALRNQNIPIVHTLHWPISTMWRVLFERFASPNQYFISISDAQRRPAPHLPYARTVYHGLDTQAIPFSSQPGSYLLFVGRIVPEKGVHHAITVAKKLGERLIIVGPHSQPNPYWDQQIKPHLSDAIQYFEFLPRQDIYPLYSGAKATLLPIEWEEPFGMVMIESLACGTPIIAFRHGSVPEIIRDGVTGYIVDTVEEMTQAVQRLGNIDRRACRADIENRFSLEQMASGYEEAYRYTIDQTLKRLT